MEKVLKYKHQYISGPRVILFKEDLEKLAELFYSNFDEIRIEADEYKLKDISEINDLNKDVICDFRISGKSKDIFPEITLDISKKSTDIHIDGYNDAKCLGVNTKIGKILSGRRRILNIFTSLWSIAIITLFNFLLFSILIYYKNAFDKKQFIIISIILYSIMIILLLLMPFLSSFIFNSINLKYSWDKPSFFKRNKDRIIIGIICAIFGGISTLIVSFIIKKLSNAPNP